MPTATVRKTVPTTGVTMPQRSQAYLKDQLAGLTSVELLVKVYDAAIVSCKQGDQQRLSRALVELIGALNFDHREIAVGLFRMYNYCLRNAKVGRFDLVEPVLIELRDVWGKVVAEQK